jgi:hypothetical protein
MQLDIRYPIGFLFGSLGLIITAYGILTDHPKLGININLWWGLVLVVFGTVMLVMASIANTERSDNDPKP